jgi:hypothetical protein
MLMTYCEYDGYVGTPFLQILDFHYFNIVFKAQLFQLPGDTETKYADFILKLARSIEPLDCSADDFNFMNNAVSVVGTSTSTQVEPFIPITSVTHLKRELSALAWFFSILQSRNVPMPFKMCLS